MSKTILIATLQLTPSVNDMYANKIGGGGRVLKQEYRNLKETIVNGFFNGFFLEGGIDKIHYIDKPYVEKIRHLYDMARFIKPIEPLMHKFSLDIMCVFQITKNGKMIKADGDNRIKFLQDATAEWIGVDDSHFNRASVVTTHAKDKAHVVIVVKHTDDTYTKDDLLNRALHELSFEQMTEEEFSEL